MADEQVLRESYAHLECLLKPFKEGAFPRE